MGDRTAEAKREPPIAAVGDVTTGVEANVRKLESRSISRITDAREDNSESPRAFLERNGKVVFESQGLRRDFLLYFKNLFPKAIPETSFDIFLFARNESGFDKV